MWWLWTLLGTWAGFGIGWVAAARFLPAWDEAERIAIRANEEAERVLASRWN